MEEEKLSFEENDGKQCTCNGKARFPDELHVCPFAYEIQDIDDSPYLTDEEMLRVLEEEEKDKPW